MNESNGALFLNELTALTLKYNIEIIGEGNPPLVYDNNEKDYLGSLVFSDGRYQLSEF